jgi:hypothetical protein
MNKAFFRFHWLDAQGVSPYDMHRWYDPTLFQKYPYGCILCGKRWRPDRRKFIPVFGEIRKGKDGFYKWYNEELDLELPTGHLKGHIRHLCWDHGGKYGRMITNCLTGQEVGLRPEFVPQIYIVGNVLLDIKYWTETTVKFAFAMLKELFCFIRHPIKYRRFFKEHWS